MEYDGGIHFNLYSENQDIYHPPAYNVNDTVLCLQTNQHAIIKDLSFRDGNIYYMIKYLTSSVLLEREESELSDVLAVEQENTINQQTWLHDGAKATVFFPTFMTTSKRGFIRKQEGEWIFCSGTDLASATPFKIPSLHQNINVYLADNKIAQGWKNTKQMKSLATLAIQGEFFLRRAKILDSVNPEDLTSSALIEHLMYNPPILYRANRAHVDASNLTHNQAPTSLQQHDDLDAFDKEVWDRAYLHEYLGLHEDTQCWEYITEHDYQQIRPLVGNALPSMAIATIKKDADGNPIRAKYRIVALGNLDPHLWSKNDCFAPVMSNLELRILVAISTQLQLHLKSGDFQQAFCQSHLPPEEKYVIRPPKGCPLTPPNTYLLLKKTLYGLKRSPRHWYELATKILQSVGLNPCPNAPCLFEGSITGVEGRITLGLYVDDFIYFGTSNAVEEAFRQKLLSQSLVTFDNSPNHFLGQKISILEEPEGTFGTHLSQRAIIDGILDEYNLNDTSNTKRSPYRSGFPVDKINERKPLPEWVRKDCKEELQRLVGVINWLACGTRPDIATITNLLAQHIHHATPSHIKAAKHVLRYLNGSRDHGIAFSTQTTTEVSSYVKFPVDPTQLMSQCDANWGPQDQSRPVPTDPPLDLFKSRSLSGFLIWFGGPLHWQSKRQSITARSSCEAEIYATDECVKALQHITFIFQDLHLSQLLPSTHVIYNDNEACVKWNAKLTTKGLRHIQIRENSSRELQRDGFCLIKHIAGKLNLSDLFTKEEKDVHHFISIRNAIMRRLPVTIAKASRISITINDSAIPLYTSGEQSFNSSTIQNLCIFYLCLTYHNGAVDSPGCHSWQGYKGSVVHSVRSIAHSHNPNT